ncbi:MAG: hypothetical protein H0X24_14150 [Ktedonobacterales bacterium]|nr:hypothetical protein [Ktedonobacterales bacterium]
MSESDIARYAGGRPSLLTDALIARICLLIADGYSQRRAAMALHIGQSTLADWLARGRAGESPYLELVERLDHARAERAQTLVQRITAAADMDWKAAAWLLERTEPEDYARVRPDPVPQVHVHQHQHEIRILQQLVQQGIITPEQLAIADAQIVQSRTAPDASE